MKVSLVKVAQMNLKLQELLNYQNQRGKQVNKHLHFLWFGTELRGYLVTQRLAQYEPVR